MKLVWLVNTILPQIAESQGKEKGVIGGWTVQLADMLSNDPDTEFTVFYPQHETKENIIGNSGKIKYVGFYENSIPELEYNPEMTAKIKEELDKINPDIVHVWGSEFVHTLSMVRAFNRPEKTIISIQGLIYFWGTKYESQLPEKIVKRHTFRDFIRRDSIAEQKEKFLLRGKCEIEALKEVNHVIGRTEWDRKASLGINPKLTYHHVGEILRKEFYNMEILWRPETAESHRIFMTQSYYPIKGIHFALKAIAKVKKDIPDIKLVVTGKDMRPKTLKDRIKQDSYGKYICDLIKELDLSENIEFTGPMDAAHMIDQYLSCSAFLLPSVMENSSNSLGEAMILGVPCIAAKTGGTPDMMRNDEGWLYDCDNIDQLCSSIIEALNAVDELKINTGSKTELTEMLNRARKHARECYDPENNKNGYLNVYKAVRLIEHEKNA